MTRRAGSPPPPANVPQRLFAQNIGIAFPGYDLIGDGLFDEIVGAEVRAASGQRL